MENLTTIPKSVQQIKIIVNVMFKYYWHHHTEIDVRLQKSRKPPKIVADAINRHLLSRFDFHYRKPISSTYKFLWGVLGMIRFKHLSDNIVWFF